MKKEIEETSSFIDAELFEMELATQVRGQLCDRLEAAGFAYQPKYHIFSRQTGQAYQRIQIYSDRNPHGSDTAFASLLPKLHIEMEELSSLAMRLVEGNRSLLPAHRFVVAMPVTACFETGQRQKWYINQLEDIAPNMKKVTHAIESAALPLVLSINAPADLIELAEQKDQRLRYDQRMYIFWVTAYLLTGRKKEAKELAEKYFGVPEAYPRYATFLKNLSACVKSDV